jgi:hypothetical protein
MSTTPLNDDFLAIWRRALGQPTLNNLTPDLVRGCSGQGDMDAGRFGLRRADPQRSGAIAAESRASVPRKELRVAERRQGRLVKAHERVELGGAKSEMVEHGELLWLVEAGGST